MRGIVFLAIAFIFCTTAFAQREIPAQFPKATIAGKSAGEITINEILKAGALLPTSSELTIVHCAFTTKIGNDLITETSNSSKITDNMIGVVRKMVKGQKLVVDQIEAKTSDGKTINLETLIFFIQ
jgi:hypothetical protein